MINHILVGLGGTGGKILREFKMRMFEEYPDVNDRMKIPVALLYVDTTREMMGLGREDFNVLGQDAGFAENEFLNVKSVDVTKIIDEIDNYPKLRGIVDNVKGVRSAIGNLGEAAGQKRRAGRLLFAVNADRYVMALQDAYARCHRANSSGEASKTVHIFAGLSGGTGSGSIIDAVAQARKLWNDAKILVYAMLPERDLPKPDMDKGRYYPNAYAAMRELNALQVGKFQPYDVTGDGEPLDYISMKPSAKGVADGISVYSNLNENECTVNSFTELPRIVSDFAYSRIFQIRPDVEECHDILRAYNFENLDGFEMENDERLLPEEVDKDEEFPKTRTCKISSFSIKRIIYPEMRVLKHITYSTGEDVLNQLRYNHWSDNHGFLNEPQNKDYRSVYLADSYLQRWMLDLEHLTLEKKVLPLDKEYPPFKEDWTENIENLAVPCQEDSCPPAAIRSSMNQIYNETFRGNGVETYYKVKSKSIKEIAKEIRRTVEHQLFSEWRNGDLSMMDLVKIVSIMAEYVSDDLKKKIDEAIVRNDEELNKSSKTLDAIIDDWANSGFLRGKLLGKKNDYYAEARLELSYLMTARTMKVALEFAKELQQLLNLEFGKFVEAVNNFNALINDAIERTEQQLAAQKKKNPGLENPKGSIIEVSEDSAMLEFERDTRVDKKMMRESSQQLREALVGDKDFIDFADLYSRLTIDDFLHAFDVQLSKKIIARHEELPVSATKVLGLNILTQLKQKLDTQQKINEFAQSVIRQTGPYVILDSGQLGFQVRNNDIAKEGVNRNLKETYIALPDPEKNPELEDFAKKLEKAFRDMTPQGVKEPKIHRGGSRDNEMFIISINSGYPMRAIKWLTPDKKKYDRFMHSGNAVTDQTNAIMLHSEGEGDSLPDIFALSDKECRELDAKKPQRQQPQAPQQAAPAPAMPGAPVPPPMPGATVPPPMPAADPVVQMFLFVGGAQYGPYDYATCRQFTTTGQLTPETMVWEQGMAAWTPAGQVEKLKGLFAPAMPTPPPMPPAGGATPPPMPPAM